MKRIYLSGPMTGLPELNFPAFNAEAARLRALGFEVVNPAELNPEPNTGSYACMRNDLKAMLDCDTLALLDGWQYSAGAHLEMHVAHRVGMEIVIAKKVGMAENSITLIDDLETMILLSLDANHEGVVLVVSRRDKASGSIEELHDQGELLHFDHMLPNSSYTVDMSDGERIYGATKDLLMAHPADVLGDESEVMLLDKGTLKWRGFRRLRKPPRGVACLGIATHWYEMHMRFVSANGSGEYYKRVVPLSRTGAPLLAKVQGHNVCTPRLEGEMLVLCASVIEDAHRANTMLASVKDATEIRFPVPLDDYKAVFAGRDGPIKDGRRKAIVHWVAHHLRHSTRGKEHAVKKHTRGVEEFMIDGIRVRLTPNDGEQQ